MNSLPWLIYSIGLSDSITHVFFYVILFFIASTGILGIATGIAASSKESTRSLKRWLAVSLLCLLLSVGIQVATPNRHTATLIAVAQVNDLVAHNTLDPKTPNPYLMLLQAWANNATRQYQQDSDYAQVAYQRRLQDEEEKRVQDKKDDEDARARRKAADERYNSCREKGNSDRDCH